MPVIEAKTAFENHIELDTRDKKTNIMAKKAPKIKGIKPQGKPWTRF